MAEEKSNRRSRKTIDPAGQRFGIFTVLSAVEPRDRNNPKWMCRCDCGKIVAVFAGNLRRGFSTNCGCLRPKGLPSGLEQTRRAWYSARQRCTVPTDQNYGNYGGRGITMCDRWRESFDAFLADMGQRPPNLTLERIDNNGPYSPENCRWASMSDQSVNRRLTIFATHDGLTLPLAEWARRSGVEYFNVYRRHKKGQPLFERRRRHS